MVSAESDVDTRQPSDEEESQADTCEYMYTTYAGSITHGCETCHNQMTDSQLLVGTLPRLSLGMQ